MKHLPWIIGIGVLQAGLVMANLGLSDPAWWVATVGSVLYARGSAWAAKR